MPRRVPVRPRQRHDLPIRRVVRAIVPVDTPAEARGDPVPGLPGGARLRAPDRCEAPEHVHARDSIPRLVEEGGGMQAECRLPLLRKRTPLLPPVPVKLNRPFGGLAERGDRTPPQVTAVADRPDIVRRLLMRLGKRELQIRPESERGQPPFDSDARTPCLRKAARRRPVDPETQAPPAAPAPRTRRVG